MDRIWVGYVTGVFVSSVVIRGVRIRAYVFCAAYILGQYQRAGGALCQRLRWRVVYFFLMGEGLRSRFIVWRSYVWSGFVINCDYPLRYAICMSNFVDDYVRYIARRVESVDVDYCDKVSVTRLFIANASPARAWLRVARPVRVVFGRILF